MDFFHERTSKTAGGILMNLSPEILQQMKKKRIDKELTLLILDNYNKGKYKEIKPVIKNHLKPYHGAECFRHFKGI